MKGVFVFVSGKIAQNDNTQMQVNTPVATIGIRGTKVAGEIKPAGEESKFTVLDGEIAVATQGGTVIMGGQNETTTVTSFNAPPTAPVVLSQSEVNQSYSDVRSISGGLLNSGGQNQSAPTEAGPTQPTGDGPGGEGPAPDAAGEGQATGDEASGGEGEGSGEGEGEGEGVAAGEGAVDGEGDAEGAGDVEGAGGEGDGREQAQADGADGKGGEGDETPAERALQGDGESLTEGEQLAAEGEGGEGDATPAERALQGDGEGLTENEQQAAEGEGGDGQRAEGEFRAGDGADGEGKATAELRNDAGDGEGGDASGPQGPDGPITDQRFGEPNLVGGFAQVGPGGFFSGGPEFGGDLFGGPGREFGEFGDFGDFGDAFGALVDAFGPEEFFTEFGEFFAGEDPFGDIPPPPDDQENDPFDPEEEGTLDPPVFDDRSAEVTPQAIFGGNNIDTLIGGSGDDDIFGFEGDDILNGGAGNDFIVGGAGDDIIDGFGGVDTIQGGAGDDTIGFDPIDPDTISGGTGIDKIQLFGTTQTANAANLVSVGSIEEVDLSGIGSNTLAVTSALITAVSGTGTLSALGDGDDVVDSSSNWNLDGPVTFGGFTFDRFTDGGSTVDSLTSTFLNNNTINFNAGASLTYNIVNLGSLTTSDGTYTNDGSITLGASGDIDMTGFKTLAGTGTFTNEQSLSLQDDVIDVVLDGSTGTLGLDGTVTIDGKVIIAPTTFVDGAAPSFIRGVGTLVNQGVQSIDDGGTISVATLRNEGSLDFSTLTTTITSDAIENIAGANVNFAVDTTIDMVAGQTLTNAGLAQLQGSANLNFSDGLIANSGTLDIVAAASTLVVTNGNISMLAGGGVGGAGTLDLTASNFNIDTGVGFMLGNAGTGPHLEMASSNITGAGTLVNASDIVIDNASTISVSTFTNSNGGTLDHADGTLSVTSVFENQANANLIVDSTLSNTDISFTNDFTNSGLVQFVGANQGAITIGGRAGTLTNVAIGAVRVLDGDNSFNGVLVNPTSGTVEVDATGTGLAHLDMSSSFTNDGLLHLTALGAVATDIARFSVSGAGSTLTNTGTIAMDGGIASAVLETRGNLDNQGLISANSVSDTRLSPIVGVNGSITNSGQINISVGTKFEVGFATGTTGVTSFDNSGTVDVSGNLVLQQTTLTNTGALQTVAGAKIDVVENSVLDITSDVNAALASTITVGNGSATGEISGSGTLFNAGDLSLNNGTLSGNVSDSSGTLSIQGASNLNSGVLEFGQNTTLDFSTASDKFDNSGTIDVNGNSVLTVDTGTLENLAAGTINVFGTGTIALASTGIFSDSGTTNFGLSPGSLTIGGDMIRGDTAFMLFELGGLTAGVGGFDQLTVTGELSAGGTLDIVEFGGFDVSTGDNFTIVEAGTLTGSFREISGLDVGGGVVLDALQSANGVTLTGRAVTHQGTAADDTLTGTAGADVIVAGDGGDFVVSGGGADLIHGGAGNDIFVAADTGFGRLDGGGGTDTVRVASGDLDLTTLRGDQLSGIEYFDLTGSGNNTLTLDADIALAATGGVNPLTGVLDSLLIDGDSGDAVTAQGAWTNTGTVTIGANGYSVFESGDNGATIFVDDVVAVTVV